MGMKHVRLTGRWLRNLLIAACVAGVGVFYLAPAAAQAATIKVNVFTDDNSDSDGKCSLREAIKAANTDKPSGAVGGECRGGNGVDTVSLIPGTYLVSGEPLDITSDV